MKVSLNWIKDYVKLPEDMDLTRLAYDQIGRASCRERV